MDKKSLESQLKSNHEDAFTWTLQCCNHDQQEAQDILQNVYVKILEGRAEFQNKSSFKTWLFSVIRFTAIDQVRGRMQFESLENIEIQTMDSAGSFEDYYRSLLQRLPKRQSEVLLLSFYHEMTLEEIAGVLEISIGSVRTHYSRGKDAIRTIIANEEA